MGIHPVDVSEVGVTATVGTLSCIGESDSFELPKSKPPNAFAPVDDSSESRTLPVGGNEAGKTVPLDVDPLAIIP